MSESKIKSLNRLIKEATLHGGDPGGPYFCNKDGLLAAMRSFAALWGLTDYSIVSDHDYYRFVKKGGQ